MTNDVTKNKSIGQYIFGKQQIHKQGKTLGEGTFGKVKLATHILTGEKVAIKILEKSKIVDASDVERVTREIQILKQVRHPNLVQLYEIIETPKQLFLVMEYVNGGELFEYIVQNQRIKDVEAIRFYSQILSGIEYLHKLHVVHRDLKPENLILDSRGKLKIIDFGLSNFYKTDDLLKTACGSPCYAAPEMIAGKRYQGLQVDIWSSGIILFAMLAGYLPFEDPNTNQLYKKIIAGDLKFPKFITNEAKELIKNILNTDPQKRYTIQEIRKHSWFNFIKDNQKIPTGLVIGFHKIPIDPEIIKQLVNFGISIEYAEKCIETNRHNHVTTTYYLLLKRYLIAGNKSIADISSELFEPQRNSIRQTTQTDRKSSKPQNPLPLIQIKNRRNHTQQADDSPIDTKPRLNNSVNTQHTILQPSPTILNQSIDIPRKIHLDLQKNTLLDGSLLQPQNDVKVLKLKTPANRNYILSEYYGRFPRKSRNQDRQSSRQSSVDQEETYYKTFYKGTSVPKK
ncbi:unnamed protein product (macronuclear) [Paramecium tetraurelia]|uniref:Protein kinase domain-containing protein n=1 Tax=Paramecium tetraurelia TaxID=5888 RepID=A0BCL5_PARTE|nr:uncharacterized protein GSPATT00004376001 [Paramecium tetraurelia]CAK56282.1 unnamed protein product [Paramecium tetraurelia]|eukprot:XP_001423680.1 hypothetical protein (macronuclear) [Paramecium tetraurelia strain d4-2]